LCEPYSDESRITLLSGSDLAGAIFDVAGDVLGYAAQGIEHLAQEVKTYWKPILAIVITVYTGGLAGPLMAGFWGAVVTGAVAGATFGATLTALNGGSVSDILTAAVRGGAIGALAGGLTYGASAVSANWDFAGQALVHGVAGGLTGVAAGGSFRKGFELAILAYGAFRLYKWMAHGQKARWAPGHGTQEKPPHMLAANENESLNNVGKAVRPGHPVCGVCEGSTFSDTVNQIVPGSNAFSTIQIFGLTNYQILFFTLTQVFIIIHLVSRRYCPLW
jgi:hypothetical protein